MRFTSKIAAVILSASLMAGCATRIPPGYEGIVVNYYGSDKGVDNIPLETGMIWYNPFTQAVYEFPTFVQTAMWTGEEGIIYASNEGMQFEADISLSYQIEGPKIPSFYVQFRTDDIDKFTHGFLRNVTRDAFNRIAERYATDELYSTKKDELLNLVREAVNKEVAPIGVKLIQLGYIKTPQPPETIVRKINAKVAAIQEAEQAQNNVAKVKAEADQKIERARGEAEANQRLASSVTAQLIEWRRLELLKEAIEKWDGVRPLVEGGNTGGLMLSMDQLQAIQAGRQTTTPKDK